MIESVAWLFIGVGLAFDLLGAIGLVRLPDIYNRVQAATKCVTLGTCMILFGVFLHSGVNSLGIKALICMVFVLLTSPVGAHALARGAHISGVSLWKGSVRDAFKEFRERRARKRPGQ
jgi:multicomponent Na+:H+ antiporter subunit G